MIYYNNMIYLALGLLGFVSAQASDPYEWLEDDRDPVVIEWVEAQHRETKAYLSSLPYRDEIRKRLSELALLQTYGSLTQAGDKIIFSQQEGGQNHPLYFIEKGGEEELLLDPNVLYPSGRVAITLLESSKDGTLLGYAERENGSDWAEIKVIDLETKSILSDRLEWIKFPCIAWRGRGFYYSRFESPVKGKELSGLTQNTKVYFHRVGEGQELDELVWEDREHPLRYFFPKTVGNEKTLVLMESEGTSGCQIRVKDLERDTPFRLLIEGFESNPCIIDEVDEGFLVLTDEGAPNKKLVVMGSETRLLIPEGEAPIVDALLVGKRLLVTRLKDVLSDIVEYDLDAYGISGIRKIDLPGMGTAKLCHQAEGSSVFYTYTSYTEPTTFWRFDFETGESTVFKKPSFIPSDCVVEPFFYSSLDGTSIPMFLIHKRGIEKNKDNPTLLYGYGGFGISIMPHFDPFLELWLERGGVFAVANIRGGGEYGEMWHRAGQRLNKQNCFDDFIAAAEWLIREGWTKKERLAIEGTSNGGLLVGACMTHRPDLFAAAVPHVGVFDMLRFHLFTIGWGWVAEYGSPDDPVDYENFLRYSPLHNIKPGVAYPPTLIFTADHDDRVVPAHSFKFFSALKAAGASVHLHVTKNAGHGYGTPLSVQIEQMCDLYTFLISTLHIF